jgi:predicted transcriptional regulator
MDKVRLGAKQVIILTHFGTGCAGLIQMTPKEIGDKLWGSSYQNTSSTVCYHLKKLVEAGLLCNTGGRYTITMAGLEWLKK